MTSRSQAEDSAVGKAPAVQRARPVVALRCEAEIALCRAVVQGLAEQSPGMIYRINPDPFPQQAFALQLRTDPNGAYLSWEDGVGAPVPRASQSDTNYARALIDAAGPALVHALKQARTK